MAKVLFSHYHKNDLKELIGCLNKDYYDPIISTCIHICTIAQAIELSHPEHTSTNLYMSLCIKFVEELKQETEKSKYVTTPYVYELHEKNTTGHNCRSCSGGCSIKHADQLFQIKTVHKKIKEIIYRLRQLADPLNRVTIAIPPNIKVLQNEVQQLDDMITEMFYIEEAILIPKIQESQNNINAVS